jgi:23S rRNA pseudouridine955/2504/2580 synthase/23S rRNA pseudouridine1911/1915/1917 synthase
MLKDRLPGTDLFFAHRLDRETSGVVLIAKHAGDAAVLGRQMAAGGVGKRYVALVEGRFPGRPRNPAGAIAPDGSSIIRKKMRFFPNESPEAPPAGAKACQTRVERLTCGPALSLVSAAPATGRHHQVRATLLALGHPVVGDKIYGVDETLFVRFIEGRLTEEDWHRLRMSRQALHCAALAFDHPRTHRRRCIDAPVPPIFERCLAEAT